MMHWKMPRTPEGMHDQVKKMTDAETVAMALNEAGAEHGAGQIVLAAKQGGARRVHYVQVRSSA